MTRQSVAILVSLFLLLSCEKERSGPQIAERVFQVRTIKIAQEEHPVEYRTSGFFEAAESLSLRPEVSGRVERVFMEEGSFVKKGDPLLKVEEEKYVSAYEEALWKIEKLRKELKRVEAVYSRRKKLFEKELISAEEFEEVSAQLSSLRAEIKSLEATLRRRKLDLERTLLKSPVDGVILKRYVSPGDYVTPQSVVYEILSTGGLRFVFYVPQEIAGVLKENLPVRIKVGEKMYNGRVSYVSPSADARRLFRVKATVEKARDLRPNMYGEVFFNYKKVRAYIVPEHALQLSDRESFLWVVRDSRAVRVPVEVLSHTGGSVAVVGNLENGDRVVVEGFMFLHEGAKVEER